MTNYTSISFFQKSEQMFNVSGWNNKNKDLKSSSSAVQCQCVSHRGWQIFFTHTLLIFPYLKISELMLTHTHTKIWPWYSNSYSWGTRLAPILILTQTHTRSHSLILRIVFDFKLTAPDESAVNMLHLKLLQLISENFQKTLQFKQNRSKKWWNIVKSWQIFPTLWAFWALLILKLICPKNNCPAHAHSYSAYVLACLLILTR